MSTLFSQPQFLAPLLAAIAAGVLAFLGTLTGVLVTQTRQNRIEDDRYARALWDAKHRRLRTACGVLIAAAGVRLQATRLVRIPVEFPTLSEAERKQAIEEYGKTAAELVTSWRDKTFQARADVALEEDAGAIAEQDIAMVQAFLEFNRAFSLYLRTADPQYDHKMVAAEQALHDGYVQIQLLARELLAPYDRPLPVRHRSRLFWRRAT